MVGRRSTQARGPRLLAAAALIVVQALAASAFVAPALRHSVVRHDAGAARFGPGARRWTRSVMAVAAAAGDGQGAAAQAAAAAAAEAAAAADAAEERAKLQPETQYFLTIKTHTKIDQIPRAAWNGLLRADDAPFLKHEWLWCLEESECAVPATGWNPCHLTVRMQRGKEGQVTEGEEEGEIVAGAPCYIKVHSMGEFIFDNAWAEAAFRSGIEYYPKMLVAVPFTPASGSRVLVKDGLSKAVQDEIRRMVGVFLKDLAAANDFSSVHVNFCEDTEVAALQPAGYMHRKTMQFHWRNRNKETGQSYADFEEYLSAFRSKRRSKIKKEIKSVADAGYGFQMLRGREIPDALFEDDTIFKLYQSTIERFFYGRQYLNEHFFRLLKDHFREHVCLVLARDQGGAGEVVAGTFNVISNDGRFFGRYWGSVAPEEIPNMHFVCCYYKSIEYCIQHGLEWMEPGAGGDSFKFLRGFDPAEKNSMHWIVHPGLRQGVDEFLTFERQHVGATAEVLAQKSAVGTKMAPPSPSKQRAEGQGPEQEPEVE